MSCDDLATLAVILSEQCCSRDGLVSFAGHCADVDIANASLESRAALQRHLPVLIVQAKTERLPESVVQMLALLGRLGGAKRRARFEFLKPFNEEIECSHWLTFESPDMAILEADVPVRPGWVVRRRDEVYLVRSVDGRRLTLQAPDEDE